MTDVGGDAPSQGRDHSKRGKLSTQGQADSTEIPAETQVGEAAGS